MYASLSESLTRIICVFAASVTLAESISDGEWHLLHWRILGTTITFKVDDIASSLDLQFDVFNGDRSSEIVLYIGARPFVPGVHYFLYTSFHFYITMFLKWPFTTMLSRSLQFSVVESVVSSFNVCLFMHLWNKNIFNICVNCY